VWEVEATLKPGKRHAVPKRKYYYDEDNWGNAIIDGAGKLMNAMRKADGTYRTYDEMIKEGIETKYIGAFNTGPITTPLDINTSQGSPCAEYNYGVFTAEVEVEVATGKVKVLAMHCVADPGPIGNYLAVDGQGYSGMMHSIGYALSEDYSDVKKHATLMGAGFPYIEMIPDGENFTVEYTQTPRPSGPYGSSGCSEMFQTSDHCAVINAIYHACGVHSYNLPATPARVKEALEAKAKGTELKPDPYYLGDDFYEKLDYMKANQL
ncbi:MAG: molybdopterin cofactor-binding domain-containing protein, partial [Oscillospiraceae bacterium]